MLRKMFWKRTLRIVGRVGTHFLNEGLFLGTTHYARSRALQTSSLHYSKNIQPFIKIEIINKATEEKKEKRKASPTFKDVVGLHASKEEVMEFVSYLSNPSKYVALGAKLPKGALLLGPPGCGKTLLVKALSNEASVPFHSVAGSEFVEIIGGLGAQRIRKLFQKARNNAPCIIFIDEIDSVGRRRSSGSGAPSNSEMEQTLNQLLVEMDGMDTKAGVIVFAATNRSDLLDPALLRAGRFDRHIQIDCPNLLERKEMFNMYLSRYKLAKDFNLVREVDRFSTLSPGMSGADVARLCNEAALVAARRSDYMKGITSDDLNVALERVVTGSPAHRLNPLTPYERRMSAVQEAGRALVAWFRPEGQGRPRKVSIIPRAAQGIGLGGFTHMTPNESHMMNTKQLAAYMQVLIGGRAAEQLIFNATSDASQRYLKQATDVALRQVRQWGMSPKIGHLSFEVDETEESFGIRPYSANTQAVIESEITRLVAEAFNEAMELLRKHRNLLDALVETLLEKEVLQTEDLEKIMP